LTASHSIFRARTAACLLALLIVGPLCLQSLAQQATSGTTSTAGLPPLLSSDDNQADQSASPDASTASSNQARPGTTPSDTQNPVAGVSSNVSAPLSADQIFAVLDQQPDAVIELKSLMADLADQQGTSLQPDSITDQMLYSKIASSPELRPTSPRSCARAVM
jgi:hypothetical protein